MRLGCLTYIQSFDTEPTFNNRLYEEFVKRGHEYVLINPDDVRINYTTSDAFPASHPQHDLKGVDLFNHILRLEDEWAWEVVECLRQWNKLVMRPNRLPFADKVTMARLFTRAGIAFPQSAIADTVTAAIEFARSIGYPLIGKARRGAQGRAVKMIENDQQMVDFVAFARDIAPNFLLQEVIRPLGVDVRAFVVGGKVVAAMERFAAEGDFRANWSLSGKSAPTTLSEEEECMALSVVDLYQTPYAGVDIIRSHKGPVVLEINKAPGLKGIESTTGINVAEIIVAHFETLVADTN